MEEDTLPSPPPPTLTRQWLTIKRILVLFVIKYRQSIESVDLFQCVSVALLTLPLAAELLVVVVVVVCRACCEGRRTLSNRCVPYCRTRNLCMWRRIARTSSPDHRTYNLKLKSQFNFRCVNAEDDSIFGRQSAKFLQMDLADLLTLSNLKEFPKNLGHCLLEGKSLCHMLHTVPVCSLFNLGQV